MTAESTPEKTVREEQEAHDARPQELATKIKQQDDLDKELQAEDPEAGKLFDVPRVKVTLDTTDPTVLKLAFSGGIEIDRSDAKWVAFYNSLKAGRSSDLQVTVHVAGAKTSHRRDSEGDVDAVVQTKSLIVTDVYQDA